MKTKKTLTALALVLLIALSFAACSGAKSAMPQDDMAEAPAAEPAAMPVPMVAGQESAQFTAGTGGENGFDRGSGTDIAEQDTSPNEKIIYTGSARVETLEFDKTLEDLEKMLSDCGGYIQYSDITGADFNSLHSGYKVYRYASYQLRIPVASFKGFNESLSTLGNVPYSSSSATNITMEYQDTAARLTARETEQTRLLELLAKAETVEDVMTIESRLSDVRYEIESLTSQMKNWDNQVSYSTLSLGIQEVTLYTEDTPATLSYGEQLKEGFIRSLKGVGRFFKDFFKFLVTALPVIVVIAVIAVVVILIVRAASKKKKAKAASVQDKKE